MKILREIQISILFKLEFVFHFRRAKESTLPPCILTADSATNLFNKLRSKYSVYHNRSIAISTRGSLAETCYSKYHNLISHMPIYPPEGPQAHSQQHSSNTIDFKQRIYPLEGPSHNDFLILRKWIYPPEGPSQYFLNKLTYTWWSHIILLNIYKECEFAPEGHP